MVTVEKIDKSNKQQLLSHFIECTAFKTCIKDGLRNPDNKQVEWYKDKYCKNNNAIEMPASFPAEELHSGHYSKNDLEKMLLNVANGDKSLIVKFCCWLHFQLNDLAKQDFIVVGEVSKQAKLLINTLEKFGISFTAVTPEVYKELKALAKKQKAIGYSVCHNVWMKSTDVLTEILTRKESGKCINTVFCEISGTNSVATYAEELFNFYQSMKNSCIVIDGKIPFPTNDEAEIVNETALTKDFKTTVLSQFAEEKKLDDNSTKLINIWLNRYFKDLKKNEIKTLLYYGSCSRKNEVLFLELVARLPVDVIILNHAKEVSYDFGNDFLVVNGEFSSPLAKFPKEQLYTGAASIEKTLDQTLYNEEYFSKINQYSKTNSIILNVTREDVVGIWDEEIKVRPGYAIKDGVVTIPSIYAQITGLGSFSKKSYFDFIINLKKSSMCFVTEALEISPIKLNGDIAMKAWTRKQSSQAFIKRVLDETPIGILSEEKKNLLIEKTDEMIKMCNFKDVWKVFTLISILFAIPEDLAKLLQAWDLTKVNPKIVMVLTGTRKLKAEEEFMLRYLHLIGFDVLLFVPTGYGLLSEIILRSGLQKIDLGNYNFNLTYNDLALAKMNPMTRFLRKIGKVIQEEV